MRQLMRRVHTLFDPADRSPSHTSESVFFDERTIKDEATRGTPSPSLLSAIVAGVVSARGGGVACVMLSRRFLDEAWPRAELRMLYELRGHIRIAAFVVDYDIASLSAHPMLERCWPSLADITHLYEVDSDHPDMKKIEALDERMNVFARLIKNRIDEFVVAPGRQLGPSLAWLFAGLPVDVRELDSLAGLVGVKNADHKVCTLAELLRRNTDVSLALEDISIGAIEPKSLENFLTKLSALRGEGVSDAVQRFTLKWAGECWSSSGMKLEGTVRLLCAICDEEGLRFISG
eukprot:TRINITY_DN11358_c0_g1_i1.p1 TRINITY_DN11358_c0_g1~~TRINITY_DN11358_c0_g1_i1.p1  ORF type:complete len:326 (-),score=71.28 TRINITY_DN11358_c0_g1_i1:72-941(-)